MRPNSGTVEPGETVEVQGILFRPSSQGCALNPQRLSHASGHERGPSAQCQMQGQILDSKHSHHARQGSLTRHCEHLIPYYKLCLIAEPLQWTVSEGEDPDKIKSQKIKVVYLPPDGQVVEEEDEGHANQPSMIIPGPSVRSFGALYFSMADDVTEI